MGCKKGLDLFSFRDYIIGLDYRHLLCDAYNMSIIYRIDDLCLFFLRNKSTLTFEAYIDIAQLVEREPIKPVVFGSNPKIKSKWP
jgi:hypothetical protein